MPSFWLTRIVPIAFAVVSLGCSGQNFEGAWRGALPLEDAEDCRLRLGSNHRFDLSCQNEEWVGIGRWDASGDRFTLKFDKVARSGRPLSELPYLDLTFKGHGNEIAFRVAGRDYRLRRMYGN